ALLVVSGVHPDLLPASLRCHRLRAVGPVIDYHETAPRQPNVAGRRRPCAFAVRRAVGERRQKTASHIRRVAERAAGRDDARDAAHQKILLAILIVSFGWTLSSRRRLTSTTLPSGMMRSALMRRSEPRSVSPPATAIACCTVMPGS